MARRSQAELSQLLGPGLAAAKRQAGVADRFVDKNVYCIYLATLWANLVVDPAAAGLDEADLEAAHDVANLAAAPILGEEAAITAAFRFLNSKDGEQAMERAKLSRGHGGGRFRVFIHLGSVALSTGTTSQRPLPAATACRTVAENNKRIRP